jgi:hypothetical protein
MKVHERKDSYGPSGTSDTIWGCMKNVWILPEYAAEGEERLNYERKKLLIWTAPESRAPTIES